MSDDPHSYEVGEMLFLRGSIGHHTQQHVVYRRSDTLDSMIGRSDSGQGSIEIEEGTGIFVPVVVSVLFRGDNEEGIILNSETITRAALTRRMNAAAPLWATIQVLDDYEQPTLKIVQDLNSYRIMSPSFQLDISEKNPFLDKMDVKLEPGRYEAIASGYAVLLKDLTLGRYLIRFGGVGWQNFFTDAVYEVKVKNKEGHVLKDISGEDKSPMNIIHNNLK